MEDLCTCTKPGTGQRCTRPLFHKGQHSCGPSVVDRWTGKLPKVKPFTKAGLSREAMKAKFRDTPGHVTIDEALEG